MTTKSNFNASFFKMALLIVAAFSAGCTRLKLEQSKLSITLPNSEGASQMLRKGGDLQVQGSQDYGVVTPSLSSQLNCYLVFVSGPEESLSSSKCDVAGTSVPVGLAAGFTAAGSSITLDVDSGIDRVVSLVGLQTDGTVACPTLSNFDSVKSHISNPVIIGSVGKIQMAAGASMNIDIPMDKSISASKVIGECSGPIFNSFKGGGGNYGNPPAAYKIITQDGATDFNTSACVPMQLKMVDANGNDAGVSSTYSTTISATGGVLLANNPTCGTASPTLSSTFNSFNTNGFFALMPSSTISFQLATSGTTGATAITDGTLANTYNVSPSAGAPYTLNMVDAMNLKTLDAATIVPLYTCRAYMLQVQDVNHRSYPNATAGGSGGTVTTTTGFNYYTDPNCAVASSTFLIAGSSSLMNAPVFGLFTSPSMATTFTPPSMTGTVPSTISNNTFTVNTPPSPGAVTQFGFVNSSMPNYSPSKPYYVRKPTTGCAYIGEIGYFDSTGARMVVPASGGISFAGLGTNILYNSSAGTTGYDIGGAGNPILGIGTGNTITAYKVPLYACASSPNGSYSMTVSGSSGLAGVIPTTTINFTVGN